MIVKDKETKAKPVESLAYWNPSRPSVKEVPVVTVACAELGKTSLREGDVSTDKGDWYMLAAALAKQNLALAARALGLGTVHVSAFDAQEAARILNVPKDIAVVEMTPLGYPGTEAKAPPRKELSDLVFHGSHGLR